MLYACRPLSTAACALTPAALLTDNELILHGQRSTHQQTNFMAGRYVLKDLLTQHYGSSWLDWDIRPSPSGQPQAFLHGKASPINVSISHSQTMAAAVISTTAQVGIDVEDKKPRANLTELLNRIATPDELSWWQAQPDALSAFYRLWTIKEAVGKLHGTGLNLSQPIDNDIWTNCPIDDDKSVCTIAARPFLQD